MPKRQRRPDQSPEAFRRYFEDRGITVTPEKIFAFITDVNNQAEPGRDSMEAAAALLLEMVQAAKYGRSWEPYKKRLGVKKLREKVFEPDLATMGTPAFAIVEALERNELTYAQAVQAFAEHVQPASERQIENWIAAIRPRVASTLRSLDRLAAAARK